MLQKKTEKWFFEGEKIDIVSSYKYLGMYFTSTMSWELTKKSLCISADKALFIVYRFIKLYNVSMKQIFCIFDRMIVPILTYGAEIWGGKMSKCIESVHIKFCRRIMKLRNNTPESVVLRELGRYPLMVQYYKKFIAYWLKILYMDDTRYPKRLYLMLLQLENAGKIKGNWASDVKSMLYRYGFHYVWLHQGVGNHVLFLKEFVQRVQDNYIQEWQSSISSYSKLDFYCRFKIIFEPERYIEVIKNKQYMQYLCKLRTSSHCLEIEYGRFKGIPREERVCLYCQLDNRFCIENEMHFIENCTLYDDIRGNCNILKHIRYYGNVVNMLRYGNDIVVNDLAKFAYLAFKERKRFMESVTCEHSNE